MTFEILIMPNQRRLKRLKSIMNATTPGHKTTYSVGRHENNNGDYCLYVTMEELTNTGRMLNFENQEIDRLRTFAKGIIAGWECSE